MKSIKNYKKTDIILDAAIYYALFGKNIISANIGIYLPKNAFGVFVTIRRQISKIKKWPEDIHGCIGYWDNDYKKLTQNDLLENMLRVSHDAMWKDDRKSYFPPIEEDPEAFIEIDFMMQPIMPISQSGIIEHLKIPYDNNQYGIIAVSPTGRATYLPHVFNNISWSNIKESIKNKAGIIGEAQFFAYKIRQLKKHICDIFESNIIGLQIVTSFTKFLLDNANFQLRYPFPYEVTNGKLLYNNEEVRNIATIGDIVIYLQSLPYLTNKDTLDKIKVCIMNILKEDHSSQALSFLGFALKYFKLDRSQFCDQLSRDVNQVEEEFSKQEIIIGLKMAGCPVPDYDLKISNKNSIFRMNWVIQALSASNKKINKNVVDVFLKKIKNLDSYETNYLAVTFEGLCNLLPKNPRVKQYLFKIFLELEKRKDSYGLYSFQNNNARVDITGHIVNGFCKIIFNK